MSENFEKGIKVFAEVYGPEQAQGLVPAAQYRQQRLVYGAHAELGQQGALVALGQPYGTADAGGFLLAGEQQFLRSRR